MPTTLLFEQNQVICQGDWRLENIPALQETLRGLQLFSKEQISIDGGKLIYLDSAGSWFIQQIIHQLKQKKISYVFKNFSHAHASLISLVEKQPATKLDHPEKLSWLAQVGKHAHTMLLATSQYLAFIGKLAYEIKTLLRHPQHMRWKELAGTLLKTGYQALPIIALLSFMIGVVIAYQMGNQLRNYGANIFIVDLLGLSILREFGPLITAIMVAGRTGSSYTAQLGLMKINQEIDALDTMGVTPGELLIIPRVIGLIISLPLLTMWANIFGVFGGMVMANNMLDITWYDFLQRFHSVIPLRALIMGIGKAPVFAFIISSIGCFQGMQVKGNANSLGLNTTRSVVLAIFFIILVDAAFSILFSKLHL